MTSKHSIANLREERRRGRRRTEGDWERGERGSAEREGERGTEDMVIGNYVKTAWQI